MSNITRLPPFPKPMRVEAEIPISQHDRVANSDCNLHRWLEEYKIEAVQSR